MQNVVLVIHLILALALIAIVLLQRSEGGGLGIGGGGGSASGRPKASPLSKVTWALALAFLTTSISLTIMAAKDGSNTSVLDGVTQTQTEQAPANDLGENLLPPSASDEPSLPPKAE